jgi:hypothetical protein
MVDASMKCDVSYLNWYLENYQGGEVWLSVIEIKGDESRISWVDCHQGINKGFSLRGTGLEEL